MGINKISGIKKKKVVIDEYLSFQKKYGNDYLGHITDLSIWYLSPLLLLDNEKDEVFSYSIWPYFVGAKIPRSDYVLIWAGLKDKIFESFIETKELLHILGIENNTHNSDYITINNILNNKNLQNEIMTKAILILSRPTVSTEELFVPATSKYFISFKFTKKTKEGISNLVFFKTEKDAKELSNVMGYASKVEPNTLVTEVISKEIHNIFGENREYRIQTIKTDETAKDRFGMEIRRYRLEILLPDQSPNQHCSGLIPKWISLAKIEDNLR